MSKKRLRPIYELLEAGNNKKVIQEVDKLLKNVPSTTAARKEDIEDEQLSQIIAKSLKCLALVRTGRQVEADKLFDDLLSTTITDENALSIMMQYCKETQQLTKIVSFYESAAKKDQKNEDILSSLYFAYVRNQDFLKQRETALKLYRQTQKKIYLYWQAVSNCMLAEQTTCDVTQKQVYLQVGERTFEKSYESKEMEMNGEFIYYINLLIKQAKHEKALTIINSLSAEDEVKIGELNYKLKTQIKLLNLMNKNDELKEKLELFLNSNGDDWTCLKLYSDICFNKLKLGMDQIIGYFNHLKTIEPLNKGPYLAILDLYQEIMTKQSDCQLNLDDLKKEFDGLIDNSTSKPGFYYDLIYFKSLITKYSLENHLLNRLKSKFDESKFDKIDNIYSCIVYWQMYRYFNEHIKIKDNEIEYKSIISKLDMQYKCGLEFGKGLLHTDQQYSDELLSLKVNFLFDLYLKSKNEEIIVDIVNDLRFGLKHSPSNFHFKLYLLHIYSNIGAYYCLEKEYNSMEIKNIQYYSTSYLILFNSIRLAGFLPTSNDLVEQIQQFYSNNLFDMANYLVNCYKYGTFIKAFEICDFIKSIRKSLTLNASFTQKFLNKCVFNAVPLTQNVASSVSSTTGTASSGAAAAQTNQLAQTIEYLYKQFEYYFIQMANLSLSFDKNNDFIIESELIDHNDTTVIENWLSNNDNLKQEYKELIDEQRYLIIYRNVYLKYMYYAIKQAYKGEFDGKLKQFNDKLNELNVTLATSSLKLDSNSKLIDDFTSVQLLNVKSNYLKYAQLLNTNSLLSKLLTGLFTTILNSDETNNKYFENEKLGSNNNLKQMSAYLSEWTNDVQKKLDAIVSLNTNYLNHHSTLIEIFSCLAETLFSIQLLFQISIYKLQQYWQEKCKKSKKKKPSYTNVSDGVDLFFSIYETHCNQLQSINKYIKEQLTKAETSSNDKLPADIKQSFICSYQQLINQFDFKLKQLQQLTNTKNE